MGVYFGSLNHLQALHSRIYFDVVEYNALLVGKRLILSSFLRPHLVLVLTISTAELK